MQLKHNIPVFPAVSQAPEIASFTAQSYLMVTDILHSPQELSVTMRIRAADRNGLILFNSEGNDFIGM